MSIHGTEPLPLAELLDVKSDADWPMPEVRLDMSKRSLVDVLEGSDTAISIIGECRRLAPSYGKPSRYSPEELIECYADRVDAINVFTEGVHFGGRLDWLTKAKMKSDLPVICLDLIGSEQALESVDRFGADAVILIAGLLKPAKLASLCDAARDFGLETIVEVQDEIQAERALEVDADIVGINTRDLAELAKVDLDLPERLVQALPPGTLKIVESGIKTPDDMRRYISMAEAVLIGSALVESPDIDRTLAAFDAAR